jgi:hypothetical protein
MSDIPPPPAAPDQPPVGDTQQAAVAAPVASGAPAAPAAAAPKKSVLPLLAIIFAGVAFLFAVIPATSGIAWIFAVTGIVLAIIALVKKSQPKILSIIAIILAPLAWIVAIIVTVATVATGIGNALDELNDAPEITNEQPSEEPGDDAEPADSPVGTRDNPAALGSTIEGRDWTIVINSVTFGATDAVLGANSFNEAPAEGSEYILINYTATYTGDDPDGQMAAFVSVEYVTAQGNTIDSLSTFAVAPDAIDATSTLYTGASVTGNTAIAVPSADADQGVVAVRPGMLDDKVFVAVK